MFPATPEKDRQSDFLHGPPDGKRNPMRAQRLPLLGRCAVPDPLQNGEGTEAKLPLARSEAILKGEWNWLKFPFDFIK